MNRSLIVLLLLLSLFTFVACSEGNTSASRSPTPTQIPSSKTNPSKVGCKAILTTSNYGDIEVTITGQQKNSISGELQYKAYHPSMGKDIYMDAWRFSNIRCLK